MQIIRKTEIEHADRLLKANPVVALLGPRQCGKTTLAHQIIDHIKSEVHFRDSGILHALLLIENKKGFLTHPQFGASWEGFALEEVIKLLALRENQIYFWGIHTGGDLDLVFEKNGGLYGIEIKYTKAPAVTASIKAAIAELSLKHVWIVYSGKDEYPLAKNVTAVPLGALKFKY